MGSSIPIPTPTLARQAAPRVLIIDNYDSYTHNLFHLWRDEQDLAQVVLIRNDQYDWDHVRTRILPHVDAVIISPGPGSPRDLYPGGGPPDQEGWGTDSSSRYRDLGVAGDLLAAYRDAELVARSTTPTACEQGAVAGGTYSLVPGSSGASAGPESLRLAVTANAQHGQYPPPWINLPAKPISKGRDHGAVMGAMVLPPIFGVCLGHQAIAAAFGSEVKQAPAIFHGQVSLVHHADASANNHTNALFQGIPSPFRAVRYHSLSVHDPLPESIIPIAWTHDAVSATETARVVMALRHRTLPLYGVQFHPESVCTTAGRSMLDNFFQMVDDYWCQSVPTSTPSSPTGLAKTQRPSTLPIAVQEMSRWRYNSSIPDINMGRHLSIPTRELKGKPGLAPPAAAPAPQFSVYCQALPGIMSKATFISPDRDESALFRHLYSSSPAAFWLDSARKGSPQSRFSYFGDFTGSGACTMRYRLASKTVTALRHSPTKPMAELVYEAKLSENLRPRSSLSTNGGDPPTTFWQWLAHWLPDVETSSVLQPWETTELDIANSIPTALAFRCGLVGIMGYDMKAETMGASPSGDQPTVSLDTPSNSPPSTTSLSTSWPDATFGFTDRCMTLDHDTGSIYLLTLVRTPTHSPAQSPSLSIADTIGLGLNYADGRAWTQRMTNRIKEWATRPPQMAKLSLDDLDRRISRTQISSSSTKPPTAPLNSNDVHVYTTPRVDYVRAIEKSLDYIQRGESYELCLTTPLVAPLRQPIRGFTQALDFYLRVRRHNPAPYAAFLYWADIELVIASTSPERFLAVSVSDLEAKVGENGKVERGPAENTTDGSVRWAEMKPIKGTARRPVYPGCSCFQVADDLYTPVASPPSGLWGSSNPGTPASATLASRLQSPTPSSPSTSVLPSPAATPIRPVPDCFVCWATHEAHDQQLAVDLAHDVKERAENLMIVDLIRHDLFTDCVPSSVHVPHLMVIESYQTVHQMVTTVRGQLRPQVGAVQCLTSCFPPGSMTGAPKHRSVEILETLESELRLQPVVLGNGATLAPAPTPPLALSPSTGSGDFIEPTKPCIQRDDDSTQQQQQPQVEQPTSEPHVSSGGHWLQNLDFNRAHGARGLYSGCLGYFSVHGAMDMSVVIRTTIVGNQGSQVYLGAGGAITVLSDPDREYDEVLTKFSAVWPAIRDLVGTPNDTVA
ncbi:para-aminobenzoate synthase, (PABA) [Dimargaris cristalligena]|nr:para-aminobenzoate synthase, (PABA) [Dimargaris cristalligena]